MPGDLPEHKTMCPECSQVIRWRYVWPGLCPLCMGELDERDNPEFQEDKMKYTFRQIYATFITLFAMIYLTAVTFSVVPESGMRIADTVTGFLIGTALTTLISFFFGDSEKQSIEPPKN